jgi:hypothetical protein
MSYIMEHPSQNRPESARAAHEMTDASARPIFIFGVVFLIALGLIYLLGWAAYIRLERAQSEELGLEYPTDPLPARSVPPEPRLEPEPSHDTLPRADLMDVKRREDFLIGEHAWAWADSSHRFARIPVQEAIDLAVERGLPTVLPATQPSNQPFMQPASALHGPGGVP